MTEKSLEILHSEATAAILDLAEIQAMVKAGTFRTTRENIVAFHKAAVDARDTLDALFNLAQDMDKARATGAVYDDLTDRQIRYVLGSPPIGQPRSLVQLLEKRYPYLAPPQA